VTRWLLVTCGGLGAMRPAPGTWGSLPPAGIAWLMLLLGAPGWWLNGVLLAILLASCIICVALGPWSEQRFGKKDPSYVVIDETAGQCIPLMFWPTLFLGADLSQFDRFIRISIAVGAAFVLFRLMDIIKPPPANRMQRLPAGWGILVDDLFAGLYAAIIMQVGLRLLA